MATAERRLMSYVLSPQIVSPIPTDQFVAVEITDPKKTASIIKLLNEKHPLTQYNHLRRVKSFTDEDGVKRLHILLCPYPDTTSFTDRYHIEHLSDTCQMDMTAMSTQCYLTKAASRQPITRQQDDTCRKLWPTFFHLDKSLESKLGVKDCSEEDNKYIEMALELAKESTSSDNQCGAVIIDPVKHILMGRGFSRSDTHVLQHATMLAIDSVAHTHGGGVWHSTPGVYDSALCNDESSQQQGGKRRLSNEEDTESGYICTGYTAYLTHEPCTMCAMSLLHSRITRVHYNTPTKSGALGSMYLLHCNSKLNHNFTVTRTVIPGEDT